MMERENYSALIGGLDAIMRWRLEFGVLKKKGREKEDLSFENLIYFSPFLSIGIFAHVTLSHIIGSHDRMG